MKKWFFLLLAPVFIFSSCNKESAGCGLSTPTGTATAAETAYLQNYLTAQSITATNINGMFYNINSSGTGAAPNQCSSISVTYTGTYITGTTDGSQFDASATPVSFTLGNLITGWRLVLPLIKAGSTVTLYIPPTWGYGAGGSGSIPGNSYLKFVINLVSVS